MRSRLLLLALAFLAHHATAGDDAAKTRLLELQTRVIKQEFKDDKLRRELLNFAREQVGTPLYPKVIEALRPCPAPLDRLDVNAIEEEDRIVVGIDELVAYGRPHARAVASLAFSFDGTMLASSSWDNSVHIYKLGAKEPMSWAKLDASPSGIAFSPDGKFLATGCDGTHVIVWDMSGANPKQGHKLSGHQNRPFSLAFAPKGKTLASGCFDPALRVFKLDDLSPELWAVSEKSRGISSLAFSHDAKFLVAGSQNNKETLRVWNTAGDALKEKPMPAAVARLLACSPTEPTVAFAGDEAAIHLWNIGGDNVEKLRTLAGHTGKAFPPLVKALAFAPDGKMLASGGQDKFVRVWNVATGKNVREWKMHTDARALAFSSDGRHLAIGRSDGTICWLRLEAIRYKP